MDSPQSPHDPSQPPRMSDLSEFRMFHNVERHALTPLDNVLRRKIHSFLRRGTHPQKRRQK